MSWQSYVDKNLVGTGSISQAAIHGHNSALWATSPGFTVSSAEFDVVFKAFNDPKHIQANGLHVDGKKYFTLRADDRSIYGKEGANGIVIVKTKQAVIFGRYVEGTQPGTANKIVEALGDYLINLNY
ncbi:13519_t:CDS:2 [Ambispora gerdemannii]|uniref:Profilin n=1 Tax=Ambispora gerdemannii TaxID=144530 RepID=A0A9N8V3L2_9GLOM|nr:13519_t:CDS:2 [Ambispora gerdemannii]